MRAEWFELPEEENKKSGIIISWTHPKKLEIAETHTRKIPKWGVSVTVFLRTQN